MHQEFQDAKEVVKPLDNPYLIKKNSEAFVLVDKIDDKNILVITLCENRTP